MTSYSIYEIKNIVNGKLYIGFSQRPESRFKAHINDALLGKKKKLYSAMRKYGIDNFSFRILYQSTDREHTLIEMEPYFIKEYDSINSGYNMNAGGFNVNTDDMRAAASARMKRNNPMKNKKINRGSFKPGQKTIMTDDRRKKHSLSKLGKLNPMFGNKDAAKHLHASSFTCNHCGLQTTKGNVTRWHNDNCKHKINES